MISLDSIRGFFPKELQTPPFAKHLLFSHARATLVMEFPRFIETL